VQQRNVKCRYNISSIGKSDNMKCKKCRLTYTYKNKEHKYSLKLCKEHYGSFDISKEESEMNKQEVPAIVGKGEQAIGTAKYFRGK